MEIEHAGYFVCLRKWLQDDKGKERNCCSWEGKERMRPYLWIKNLSISVIQKEVPCECEGLTGSEKNRNFEPCFQKQDLRELWDWSRQKSWWIELSGRMQSKVWIWWCQIATLHIPGGITVFMLMRGWEVLRDKRAAWRRVEYFLETTGKPSFIIVHSIWNCLSLFLRRPCTQASLQR